MSDERLRQLERAAAAGDPEAQARLGAARRRSLDLEAVSELLRDDPEKTIKALLRPLEEEEVRRVQECVSGEVYRRRNPPRESIRLRPAMYIGDAYERGLHETLLIPVGASIDAALVGAVSRIEVTLDGSQATAYDDLPRAPGLLEQDLVAFDTSTPQRFLYLTNTGALSFSNALSARLDAEIVSPGEGSTRLSFVEGIPVERDLAPTCPPGTRITLQADPSVLRTTQFSFDRMRTRLQELAHLVPGLRIRLEDVRAGRQATFESRGLVDYLNELAPPEEVLGPPFVCTRVADLAHAGGEVRIDVALNWRQSRSEELTVGYVNTRVSIERGDHIAGLDLALGHVFPSGGRGGLIGIVSVFAPVPELLGATRSRLVDPEIGAEVRAAVEPALKAWLDAHPQSARLRGR